MAWLLLLVGALLAAWAYLRARAAAERRRGRRRTLDEQAAALDPAAAIDPADPQAQAWAVLREPVGVMDGFAFDRRSAARQFRLGTVFGLGLALVAAGIYLVVPGAAGDTRAGTAGRPPLGSGVMGAPGSLVRARGKPGARAGQPGPGQQPGSGQEPGLPPGNQAGGAQPAAGGGGAGSVATVIIEAGEIAPQVAAKLEAAGLIPSRRAFLDRLVERQLDTRIRQGTFRIPAGQDLDTVIDILTR